MLLPQQADQSYISLLVTQKAALSEKAGGVGHVSLQVNAENKASGMGGAHSHSDGEVKMRCRTEAGISWLALKHCQQLLHLAQILICLLKLPRQFNQSTPTLL